VPARDQTPSILFDRGTVRLADGRLRSGPSPFTQGGFGLPFIVLGRPLDGVAHGGGAFVPVSPTYFGAFRIPVVRGRPFTDRGDGGAPGVAIINQAMARRYWPDGNPLTDRLTIGRGLGPQLELRDRQIVGVVGDVRGAGLNRDPQPAMYVPWSRSLRAILARSSSRRRHWRRRLGVSFRRAAR
jgi:putative ABC transport system permease protein